MTDTETPATFPALSSAAVSDLLAVESDFVSADTTLAQLMDRFRSLPIEESRQSIADLRDIRSRLLGVLVRLDAPIAEAGRIRDFELSLNDLPF